MVTGAVIIKLNFFAFLSKTAVMWRVEYASGTFLDLLIIPLGMDVIFPHFLFVVVFSWRQLEKGSLIVLKWIFGMVEYHCDVGDIY